MAGNKEEKGHRASSRESSGSKSELENTSRPNSNRELENMNTEQLRARINAKIANPLAGFSREDLYRKGEEYAREHQMGEAEDIRAFQIGAQLAQDPNKFDDIQGLTGEENAILSKEISRKWSQPRLLYLVIVLCSTCAAVQGMGMIVLLSKPSVRIILTALQMKPSSTELKSSTVNNLASRIKVTREILGFLVL